MKSHSPSRSRGAFLRGIGSALDIGATTYSSSNRSSATARQAWSRVAASMRTAYSQMGNTAGDNQTSGTPSDIEVKSRELLSNLIDVQMQRLRERFNEFINSSEFDEINYQNRWRYLIERNQLVDAEDREYLLNRLAQRDYAYLLSPIRNSSFTLHYPFFWDPYIFHELNIVDPDDSFLFLSLSDPDFYPFIYISNLPRSLTIVRAEILHASRSEKGSRRLAYLVELYRTLELQMKIRSHSLVHAGLA